MAYWEQLTIKLERALDLLLSRHPAAGRVLLGEVPPPTVDEIMDLLGDCEGAGIEDLGVRVTGGMSTPEAERRLARSEWFFEAIDGAGGWEHIAKNARQFRDAFPEDWHMAMDHASHIKPGGSWHPGDGGLLARIARKHGVAPDTVQRRRKLVLRQIARCVVIDPPDGGLRLLGLKKEKRGR